jgi:CelD/BcsL family acetyltransferase involved in cellulose biosynthesis
MKMFVIDPTKDPRWTRLIERHPRASVFHTRNWLETLRRTYGYEPVVYTTTAPTEELTNGIVFCKIESWLTGRRLVSLPFSDYCEPLCDSNEELEFLTRSVIDAAKWEGYKYVEIRPLATSPESYDGTRMAQSHSFYLHTIDLRPTEQQLLSTLHKSCVRQKIKRADREGLSYVEGYSSELVRQFYRLLITTRRRHQLPPQPLEWFENLADCMNDMLTIHVARKDGRPIASILTLSFKDSVYYKYGCSDERFHNMGGMQMLIWLTIQQEKQRGAKILDLGRSDVEQTSLVSFKDHFGSTRSLLNYYRYPAIKNGHGIRQWSAVLARYAFARLPNSLLTTAGRILYPHIG